MSKDINDVHTAVYCLHQLLAVIYEQTTHLYDGELDRHTRATADCLSGLAILARDEAERIDAAIEACIADRKPKASLTPVQSLFQVYLRQREEAYADATERAAEDIFAPMNATEKLVLAAPAETMQDLAAKIIVATDHGAYPDLADGAGGMDVIREAAVLVGREQHLEGGAK